MAEPAPPVRYDPALETIAREEPQWTHALKSTLAHILDTTSRDYDHAVRAVHAKGHGIVRGSFEVLDRLPPPFAQGLFTQPGRYEAILRCDADQARGDEHTNRRACRGAHRRRTPDPAARF